VDASIGEVRRALGDGGPQLEHLIEVILKRFLDRFTATAAAVADAARAEPAVGASGGSEEPLRMSAPAPTAAEPAPAPAADEAGEIVTVWFGTNRQLRNEREPGRGFSSRLEDDPDTVRYGTCSVFVPESHKFGSLGSASLFERAVLGKDDRLKLRGIDLNAAEDFWQSVTDALRRCGESERQALVFLHGYSCSFEGAALRTAQIAADLKPPGIAAFFSWPSKGNLLGYLLDEARIEASEGAITDFLTSLATNVGAKRVHVIAHSMGNLGLLRAMDKTLNRAARASAVQFGQVFLAAPDVDVALFRQLAVAYPQLSVRTTIYISPRDWAVRVSRLLRLRAARVGFAPPVTVMPGMDTVWVPDFHLDLLGHSYYAKAAGVLNDMAELLRRDDAPSARPRLVSEQAAAGLPYWRMRE